MRKHIRPQGLWLVREVGDGASSKPLELAYSAATLQELLGWKDYKVETALLALALIEEGMADDEDFRGLSSSQAQRVAGETRRIAKETGKPNIAKTVSKRLAEGMRHSVKDHGTTGRIRNVKEVTIHTARQKADDVAHEMGHSKKKGPPPDLANISVRQMQVEAYVNQLIECGYLKVLHGARPDGCDEFQPLIHGEDTTGFRVGHPIPRRQIRNSNGEHEGERLFTHTGSAGGEHDRH